MPRDLLGRGAVVGVVLVEEGRALHDLVAARDVDRGDEALLGRPDLDEIGLGIALPLDDLGVMRAQQEPPAREEGCPCDNEE